MDLKSLDIGKLKADLVARMEKIATKSEMDLLNREWLGKEGVLKSLFAQLREVSPEEKPKVAAALNDMKKQVEEFTAQREADLQAAERADALKNAYQDVSLPGFFPGFGRTHPVTLVERKISELLRPFGFRNVYGPEVETEYYCFDSLNIPPHHPARDMQDTFYTATGHVLRTHTTSVQARTLEKGGLPVKIASFGRVFRNETEDASHTSMFHQFELVWLEEGLTLSHLMALITHILKGLYGKRRKVRFVPKFYPYTEPSIGPQIDCSNCGGAGCSFCGGAGWVTVAGSGMVHRNVLTEFKYDPEKVTGFAFGLGTSRLAAQFERIPDGRLLYEGDLRVFKSLGAA